MALTLKEFIDATGGRVAIDGKGSNEIHISTDTRSIKKGEYFLALKGENFDGHDHIKEAADKGAGGAIVSSVLDVTFGKEFTVIEVSDTLRALGDAASYLRQRSRAKFVAITGTSGKTTTKEMAAKVLSKQANVLCTKGNLNNLIGVPLTLLELDDSMDVAVIEIGINEVGEMDRLAEIVKPDVAVITNIGRGHLHGLGTIESVANEKAKVFDHIKEGGVMVVNADDSLAVEAAKKRDGLVVNFGFSPDVTVRIDEARQIGMSGVKAEYNVEGRCYSVEYDTPLASNSYNGACVLAILSALDMDIEKGIDSLGGTGPVSGRMELKTFGGVVILDDTYNANPDSTEAALKTLQGAEGNKIAVLGEMLELGSDTVSEHIKVGLIASECGIDVVVAVGTFAKEIAQGSKDGGVNKVFIAKDNKEAIKILKDKVRAGDNVLVKGSRGVKTEEIVEGLISFLD
ncbi:MAG: UDP-N-acetylmuramoyl-tripeptide--D-alanyl-D-alanine ligase [Deltaproteobacteria bacterium]|nr:UDP-N-acetylmuramoyl-tripeptide--D-alanyl-D-alanine ligase [Deltaproteobacteria bacterium]